MTVYESRADEKEDLDLANALSKALRISSSKEIEQMKAFLYPCLLCTAAKCGDNKRIEELLKSVSIVFLRCSLRRLIKTLIVYDFVNRVQTFLPLIMMAGRLYMSLVAKDERKR
jgi:hypothetical protein